MTQLHIWGDLRGRQGGLLPPDISAPVYHTIGAHYTSAKLTFLNCASVYPVMMGERASQARLLVKNPPANAGEVRDSGLTPDQEDPLEEGMAPIPNSFLTPQSWRIPLTGKPGGLQSMGSHRSRYD